MLDSSRQIKLGVVMSYITIGINILTSLVYTPWMISSIGREDYGLFTLANSVIAFFMFDFGLSSAITRFVAKYLAEDRQDKVNNCLGIVYKLYFYIDVLFFIILTAVYFLIPEIYKELTPEEIEKFKVVYAIAAIYSIFSFPFIPVNGILTANEKFVPLKICELAHKLLVVGAMTVCLLLGYGLYALVLVHAGSGIITILAKLWVIQHYTPTRVNIKYKDKVEQRNILGFSGWTMIVQLSQRFVITIAPTILGVFSGSTAIAILGIAISIEGYTYTFSNAIGGMFLPKVSRVIVEGDGDILPLMIKVGRFQILIVGAIVFGFICLGQDFIHCWVGDGFKDSYLCAVLMIIPSYFLTPEEIACQTVLAKNRVKQQAIIYFLCSVFNLVVAFSLSASMGPLGIGISICATYMLRGLLLNIFVYYKSLNINIIQFIKESFLKFLPMQLIAIGIGCMLNVLMPHVGWAGFILKLAIFIVSYCALLYFALNKYEKNLLFSYCQRLFKK